MKTFVLVLSLSLFVYRESVHMPAKKKKDLLCRSSKRASRKDQDSSEAETLPEAEKTQAGRKHSRIILFTNRAVAGRI